MIHEGLTLGPAAKYTGRHPKTLQAMDRAKVLPAKRTSTGRRYWWPKDLDAYLGRTSAERPRRNIPYCRVSSQGQRPDLKNQRKMVEEFCIAKGIANVEFMEEIGGGLNFKRPKFLSLVDSVVAGEVAILIVAHRDRFVRFGFDWIRHLCGKPSCELLLLNTEQVSPEQEMVQDLMAITHGFSSRRYGLRNYRKALKAALK